MNSKTALLSAVLSAFAFIASGASAATSSETRLSATVPSASSAVQQLARHGGRRNDDPVGGEDAGCDDHGTDLCAIKLSKHGADDAVQTGDDKGVDLIFAKHGADDLVDGDDDRGVDFVRG